MPPDNSKIEPAVPDATGELRELVQEVMDQDDPRDTPWSLAVSAGAMVVAAAILGFVGSWLLRGGLAAERDGLHDPFRDSGTDIGGVLIFLGSGTLLVSALLGVFALVGLAKIVAMKVRAREG